MSANYNVIHSTNVKTLFILIFIFFSLFSLIVILSKYVFKPIKESFDKQNRFISDASHELKTPITIISANADVLSQDNKDNDWVENIKSQTKRLDYLVKDLLSLAKLNETKLTLNKTNVNLSDEVLNEVLQFDALAFEKEKILSTDISPNINANIDIVSLKKVLNILMDNAIKYSSIKGEIKVSLKKEKTKIKLTVFNSGSSVPDELSDKLFERFFRVEDSRSRESGGSGLGLSIAKRICILNKWKITAQSKLNDSMKITVVL